MANNGGAVEEIRTPDPQIRSLVRRVSTRKQDGARGLKYFAFFVTPSVFREHIGAESGILLLPICFRFAMKLTKANLARFTYPAGKAEHVIYDDDLAGFGLRMHPGGRRTWFVQYRVGQKQRRLKIGTADQIDAEEARQKAKVALAKVHLGADPALETEEAKAQAAITLTLTVEDYLARYASKRLKPGSLAEVERHLRRHWKPLGQRPLASITRALVAKRLAEIARDNGPFAANRARAACRLSLIGRSARASSMATRSPARIFPRKR